MATTVNEIFVSPEEVEVAQLNTTSVAAGSAIGNNYVILSDKRLYYKGAAVSLNGSNQFASGEAIVDLKNVTGTSFAIARFPLCLFFGVILLIAGIAANLLVGEDAAAALAMLPILLMVFGVIFILMYIFNTVKTFVVNYRGGTLSFRIKGLSFGASANTFRSFCHAIHAAAAKLND